MDVNEIHDIVDEVYPPRGQRVHITLDVEVVRRPQRTFAGKPTLFPELRVRDHEGGQYTSIPFALIAEMEPQ